MPAVALVRTGSLGLGSGKPGSDAAGGIAPGADAAGGAAGGASPSGSASAAVALAKPAGPSPLEMLRDDPMLRGFLEEQFDATKFASAALAGGHAASAAAKLAEGIALLETELRTEVVQRHGDLLQQVTSLKDTENALGVVRNGVASIQAAIMRVRSDITEPYRQIKAKTAQLAALHKTVELLRHVIRLLRLSQRLRDLLGDGVEQRTTDLAKAAQLLHDANAIHGEADLSGVEVVEAESAWLADAGRQVRQQADELFRNGMESLNQAEVGTVLQVYYNLGELNTAVTSTVSRYSSQSGKAVHAALDANALSSTTSLGSVGPGGVRAVGAPAFGASGKWQDTLWQRFTACTEKLHGAVVAVWHLQRVLAKKRDPITHICFLDEVVKPGEPLLTETFWRTIVDMLSRQLSRAFNESSMIRETFVNSYPKLVALLHAMFSKIQRDTDVKGVPPGVRPEDRDALARATVPYQTAYLTQSLSRLMDIVHAMFPGGSRGVVSPELLRKFLNRMHEEVDAVIAEPALTVLVVQGISKALFNTAQKAEYQIATGPESRQVSAAISASQQRNIALCNHMQEVYISASELAARLPEQAADALSVALENIYSIAEDAVTPLFRAMIERLENCLLQLHEERFSGSQQQYADVDYATSVSPYMEELQRAVLHFRKEFLSHLSSASQPTSVLYDTLLRQMATRLLLFFVRHASLIRPLSEAGKLRLARDTAELELVVAQNIYPVEKLGAPYRALRAFRPLIFLETHQLESSPLLQELPASAVLHHLFTRGPDELQSPHRRAGLTAAQYSLWLDQHSEEDVWRGVKASLDAYAQLIKSRGEPQFAPIYPIIMSVGQRLIEREQNSSRT
eukprot:jgi/Chlat1/2069/Chrsp17S02540